MELCGRLDTHNFPNASQPLQTIHLLCKLLLEIVCVLIVGLRLTWNRRTLVIVAAGLRRFVHFAFPRQEYRT